MNDTELSKHIKDILEEKMEGSSIDINVKCNNGNVTLYGMVDVLAEKLFAEKIIIDADNNINIENNLTIATDGYIPDSDIEKYVLEKLTENEDLKDISCKCQSGSVSLYGSVSTCNLEKKAIELAEQARGVKTVTSNISNETDQKYTDDQIVSIIHTTLNSNEIDSKYINPEVKNNSVTLNGFVRSQHESELAEELISKLEGVTKVKNNLHVAKR